METYERMYWSLSSDLDAATARQNELVSAQSVKVFDKIFPAFPEMLREKKALISSYKGNVPWGDIQAQLEAKYKDLFAQTDAFWDELRELSGVLTRAELIESYWSNGTLKPKKDEYTKEIEKGHWSSRTYTKKHCVEYYVNDWVMPKIAYDYAVYLSNLTK